MRGFLLSLGLCLLALVAGLWLWLDADLAPPPGTAPAAGLAGERDAPAVVTTAGAPEAAELPRTGLDDDNPDDEIEPEDDPLQRTAAAAGVRGSPVVQVVRGEPPVPVADAVVWFLTLEDAERRLGAAADTLPRPSWPERVGQRGRTDGDGRLALPRAGSPWLVTASAGAEFGLAIVPPRDRTETLRLAVDETVTLAARFPDGAPAAHIPLAVLQRAGDRDPAVLWQGPAGADGTVVLAHFQLLRQPAKEPGSKDSATESFAAVARVPTAEPVWMAGRPAAAEPVLVPVPPLGEVLVQLVDHRGIPLLSPAVVGFPPERREVPPGRSTAPVTMPVPRDLQQQRRDKPPGDQPVRLPYRELQAPMRVFARFPHDRQPAAIGPIAGPAQPGERVAVALPLGPQQLVLAGRLLLAPDRPVAGGTVAAALWRADRDVSALVLHPIADGRFDLVLGQRQEAAAFWLELRLELPAPAAADGAPSGPPTRLGARVRIPNLAGGSRHELGEVLLAPLPLLVHGIVVDDRGEPIADADVHVQQQDPPAPDRDPAEAFHTLPLFRTRSGPDGTFAIDGELPPGALRVRADTDRHFAASLPLPRPGQPLRLEIARNGILRGRVLLPDWLPDRAISLQLVPFDPAAQPRGTMAIELGRGRGGRFVVEPLRPGRYDARVLLRNVNEPLLVLPDVFVQPGETVDPRLRPLDLRASLHRYRLRAIDAAGQPLALDGPILGRLQNQFGTVEEAAFRWQGGRAELITPSPQADLTFFGRGLRTTRLSLPPGDHDVQLPTLRPVLVELPGLRSLCGPSRKVRISAILQGETGLPGSLGGADQRTGERFGFARWDLGRTSGGWLGDSDTVEIPLMQSGRYDLLLRPHASDTERSPQGELRLGTFELDVENGAFRPVRVPIDAIAVGTMLQQLDQRAATAAQDGGNRRGGRPGR
ncbi:MAG: hypothetical protein MUC36_10515 [Planctomycetes bacterium]|nr:hypothetical protein [Planctomycetota bacterium]